MSDIFVSYSRHDRAIAAALAEIVPHQGWTLYWDRQLRAGEIYDDVLEREVTAARCVVVLWSSSSVRSQWVRNEADVGAGRNALISVLIENVTPPLAFRRVQAADLIGWKGDPDDPRLTELLQSISYFLGGNLPVAPDSPGSKETVRSSGNTTKLIDGLPLTILLPLSRGKTFSPETIERAEGHLARFVGPIASWLVKQSAERCSDMHGLYQDLAQHVPPENRQSFLRLCSADVAGISSQTPRALPKGFQGPQPTEKWITDLRKALAEYLGPIAGVVATRVMGEATSREEILDRVSAEIPDEPNRQAFLKRWRR